LQTNGKGNDRKFKRSKKKSKQRAVEDIPKLEKRGPALPGAWH